MSLMNQNTAQRDTRRPARHRWLGLAAVIALLSGLLVPISATTTTAAAAFGKPTSVSASKISGSNGIKVKWKAPTGKPAAYKVSWGKSSSASKATYATYVTGTSATLSASGMSTKANYYVWVQPWSVTNSTGKATGALSSSDKVKTSSFAYHAPVVVHVANVTKTTAEVTWRTVTGSPGYVIRAYNYTTKSNKYQVGFDGSSVFTGLNPGTKYKFTIANRLLISGYDTVPGVRMSGYSSASATKTTNRSTTLDAPTDLTLTDRNSDSITLSWKRPAGSLPGDKVRVYWAENQEMTDNDGYTKTGLTGSTGGTVKGLDSNTNYYVRIQMVRDTVVNKVVTSTMRISDRTTAIMAKTRSPKGFVAGSISGVDSSVLSDYVAVAYGVSGTKPGDVKGTANVSSAGNFKMELRPGTYFVQVAYVGTGNYTTVWLTNDGSVAYGTGKADTVKVTLDTTKTIGSVDVRAGAIVSGTVSRSGSGAKLRDIFVSARTSSERQVVGQATTDSSGKYTLKGLPPGTSVIIRVTSRTGSDKTKDAGTITTPGSGSTRDYDITMVPA